MDLRGQSQPEEEETGKEGKALGPIYVGVLDAWVRVRYHRDRDVGTKAPWPTGSEVTGSTPKTGAAGEKRDGGEVGGSGLPREGCTAVAVFGDGTS